MDAFLTVSAAVAVALDVREFVLDAVIIPVAVRVPDVCDFVANAVLVPELLLGESEAEVAVEVRMEVDVEGDAEVDVEVKVPLASAKAS